MTKSRRVLLRAVLHPLLISILLTACSPAGPTPPPATPEASSPTPTSTTAPRPSSTSTRIPTDTATPTPLSAVTPTPFAPGQCPDTTGPAPTLTPGELEFPDIDSQESLLLNYLNTVGSAAALEENLNRLTYTDTLLSAESRIRAHVRTIDLTGDGFPEVAVSVISYYDAYGTLATPFVFIFGCDDFMFHTRFADYYGGEVPEFSEVDGLRAIRDLNRNGIPEIVLSIIAVRGVHGYYHRVFRILEWDGSLFQDLIPVEFAGATQAMAENADGVLLDTDGDGTIELVLTQGLAAWYGGPQRVRSDTWAWDGVHFSLRRWVHTPPVFRFQAVQDGDDASRFGEYDRALAFYQQAIFDEMLLGWTPGYFYDLFNPTPPPLNPDERPRLEAYSRYRIILLHAVEGRLDAAKITYSTLQQKFSEGSLGSPFAAMATAFWDVFLAGGGITEACASAIEYARDHEGDVLAESGFDYYSDEGFFYEPEDLCPFIDS